MKTAEVVTSSHETDLGEVRYKLSEKDKENISFGVSLIERIQDLDSISFDYHGEIEIENEEKEDLNLESFILKVYKIANPLIFIEFYEEHMGEKFCVQVDLKE